MYKCVRQQNGIHQNITIMLKREREKERNIDTIFDKNGKINGQIVLITVTT